MINTNTKTTNALSVQKKVGIFDFPFTMNPYIGCEMQCAYCFVPGPVIKRTRREFFTQVDVKENIPELLKKELKKYSDLPQHLKRVQFGVTTEIFQPRVINYMRKSIDNDVIAEIFKIFKDEWSSGNKWMLHILTKNHNIIQYLDILKDMKEMIQVEMSIIHHDDSVNREYEKFTSSINRRLDAIIELAKEDIFVRVMAMPFVGEENDLLKLKDMVFNAGAKAFKNKSLNYYAWDQLKNINPIDPLNRSTVKTNRHIPDMIIKSGEKIQPASTTEVLMPKVRKRGEKFINWSIRKEGLEKQIVEAVNMGYADINTVDWKYLK